MTEVSHSLGSDMDRDDLAQNLELVNIARSATTNSHPLRSLRDDWKYMGYVGAALMTSAGNIHTGVNLQLYCGIGFCAEHSAVAEMVKNGETRILKIVAVTNDGTVLPPCGRCRELLFQIDANNLATEVIMDDLGTTSLFRELLPENWQVRLGL